eukprot:6021210-Prymnesium_polylepis.1
MLCPRSPLQCETYPRVRHGRDTLLPPGAGLSPLTSRGCFTRSHINAARSFAADFQIAAVNSQ